MKSRELTIWRNMKRRCYNKNDSAYPGYGGRGIIICDRWLESFDNFIKDMGNAPTSNHSIDRINNDGNYEPGNCRWATSLQQNNNKRSNLKVRFQGETKCHYQTGAVN